MRYKIFTMLIATLLAACSSSLPQTFAEQRAFYNWHLPIQVFNNPHNWDARVDKVFAKARCPKYLAEYMKNSSDIIDSSHVFPYSAFGLTDDCMQMLMVFMQFYLEQHVGLFDRPLYALDLSQNPALTNRSIAYILELLRGTQDINRVNLRGNPRISDDALATLRTEGSVLVDS